jgi:uncharacterized protein DUF4189
MIVTCTTLQVGRIGCCLLALIVVASTLHSSKSLAAGAFAVGRNAYTSWGSGVHDYPTVSEAQQEALRRCSSHGPCSIVATFNRACFSIAVQVGRNGYGWITHSTIEEARSAVLNHCLAHGLPCEVKVAMCDSGGSRGTVPVARPSPMPAPAAIPPMATSQPQSTSRGCERYPELCQ